MKEKLLKKRKTKIELFDIINYSFFGLFALCTIYPLYYIFINAISNPSLVTSGQITLWPKEITFDIFMEVFQIQGISQAAINSVLRTVLGTSAAVFTSAVLGYVMSRQEFKFRKFWYRYFIITMYISAGMIPTYLNMTELGFLNSFFWIYIAPGFVQAYNMILAKTYMESLPASLEEAAYIDGAGYFKRFVNIVVPLSKPVLATIAVFVAVGQWNSYMDTLLYMTNGGNQTLQSILYKFLNQSKALADLLKTGMLTDPTLVQSLNHLSIKYAVTAITITPVMLVYPFFQRFFTKGLMIGAVKG